MTPQVPPPPDPQRELAHLPAPHEEGSPAERYIVSPGVVELSDGDEDEIDASPLSYAERLVKQKHAEYGRNMRAWRLCYYVTRTAVGLISCALIFLIGSYPHWAQWGAAVISACIALDFIYDPRSKWQNLSKATDMLGLAEMKRRGEYERYKESIDVILATEQSHVEKLTDLSQLLERMQRKGP